jgi:2-keto-4-pentenoate hydratase/2-oxohepta-3-ene-1,7-dioic acid hydratase in catechol pathway
MVLLTVTTPTGPKLAVKLASGIVIIENTHAAGKASLPQTLQEALATPGALDQIRDFVRQDLSYKAGSGRIHEENEFPIGLPFQPRNLICIGLNYKDHAAESGVPLPEKPVVFAKLTGCVIGPRDPIVIPPDTREVDYEAELAVVIGRTCRGVSASQAFDYVAGYTCMNDVSARDFQRGDGQWVRAKSQDTFGPLGPYLVTIEDVPDPQALYIRCQVNGRLLQDSNTNQMIFGVRELIAFISRGITLQPGDVIATGTPPGVGFARKPPIFLKSGDHVEVEIQNLGKLENQVIASQ